MRLLTSIEPAKGRRAYADVLVSAGEAEAFFDAFDADDEIAIECVDIESGAVRQNRTMSEMTADGELVLEIDEGGRTTQMIRSIDSDDGGKFDLGFLRAVNERREPYSITLVSKAFGCKTSTAEMLGAVRT